MFRFLSRKKESKNKQDYRKKSKVELRTSSEVQNQESENFEVELFTSIEKNLDNIRTLLGTPSDLVTREFSLDNSDISCALIYIDGLVDKDQVNDKIIKNIQLQMKPADKVIPASRSELIEQLFKGVVSIGEIKKVGTLDEVMLPVLSGDTALFVEGIAEVIILGSKGWASRGVEEPVTEALIRGPRDGFTETSEPIPPILEEGYGIPTCALKPIRLEEGRKRI